MMFINFKMSLTFCFIFLVCFCLFYTVLNKHKKYLQFNLLRKASQFFALLCEEICDLKILVIPELDNCGKPFS